MRIRPARSEERYVVAHVHEETACFAYATIFPDKSFPRAETLERWQSFRGEIIVAETDNSIIGFAAFDESELHALYVLPMFQGRGVGTRLLLAAGSVSRLWVLKENLAGRKFYEAHGWRADGTEQTSFGVTEMLYCR